MGDELRYVEENKAYMILYRLVIPHRPEHVILYFGKNGRFTTIIDYSVELLDHESCVKCYEYVGSANQLTEKL